MNKYNKVNNDKMNLVLFKEAIYHITRIKWVL